MKDWKILQTIKNRKTAEELIEILLKSRGFKTKKAIDKFLNPPQPALLKLKDLGISQKELKKAVKRIKKAIQNKEEIVIYGDYDADGVCGTAILWEALDQLGAKVLPYLPHRIKEGYGLSIQGIKNIKKRMPEVKLIITVDNGISASKAVTYAQKHGLEVIITDHHLSPACLPSALAIVHTTKLSGCGVAWVLARELGKSGGLDLVAIGTIADMVPLIGPNRSLVKFGLRKLRKTSRPGLLALFKEARLDQQKIDSWTISFIISPRLNACGRLTDAMDALRLVCTRDYQRAVRLAKKINEENNRRQKLTQETFLHAKSQLLPPYPPLLFVTADFYHEGVIGLVAGDLVKEFYRPAVVVSVGKEFSKGSARSVKGLNIIKAIRQCEKFLLDCGGHPMAAGMTIKTTNLDKFKNCLTKIIAQKLAKKKLRPVLLIDFELKLSHLTWKLYELLEKLAPFGIENTEPVFCSRRLRVVSLRKVGNNGHHLKIRLDDPQTKKVEGVFAFEETLAFDGIGFGLGDLFGKIKVGDLVDIAYTLEKNVWNNEERLELKIKDIKIIAS